MNKNMYYLRISLLKVCNFNCFYCRPPSYSDCDPREFTKPETFISSISLLHRMGINKIRFTGGEPTLYKELPDLIAHTKTLDRNIRIAITTNGRLLTRLAPILGKSGLNSVNISLDTISPQKFKNITGVDCFDKVVNGIKNAKDNIEDVKLNCVVIKGTNDEELGEMVDFANDLGVDIRFIEYMPTRHNAEGDRGFVSGKKSIDSIGHKFYPVKTEKSSPARYFGSDTLKIKVGFINSVSQPFCIHCNRIRLAADGNLYTCLFSARTMNVFDLLDEGQNKAVDQIDRFIQGKEFVGCSQPVADAKFLPSFIEIGG